MPKREGPTNHVLRDLGLDLPVLMRTPLVLGQLFHAKRLSTQARARAGLCSRLLAAFHYAVMGIPYSYAGPNEPQEAPEAIMRRYGMSVEEHVRRYLQRLEAEQGAGSGQTSYPSFGSAWPGETAVR